MQNVVDMRAGTDYIESMDNERMQSEYRLGDQVQVREFGRWMPNGIIEAVMPGQGPDGETLYVVSYDHGPDGRAFTGAKTCRMIRRDEK